MLEPVLTLDGRFPSLVSLASATTRSCVYGLIHGGFSLDANVLFWRREARAVDFGDSGFGYWVYDLAIALEHCREYVEFRFVPKSN